MVTEASRAFSFISNAPNSIIQCGAWRRSAAILAGHRRFAATNAGAHTSVNAIGQLRGSESDAIARSAKSNVDALDLESLCTGVCLQCVRDAAQKAFKSSTGRVCDDLPPSLPRGCYELCRPGRGGTPSAMRRGRACPARAKDGGTRAVMGQRAMPASPLRDHPPPLLPVKCITRSRGCYAL